MVTMNCETRNRVICMALALAFIMLKGAESQATPSSSSASLASVTGPASSALQLSSTTLAVTTPTKPSSGFSLSPSATPQSSSTLQQPVSVTISTEPSPRITLSPSATPQSSSTLKQPASVTISTEPSPRITLSPLATPQSSSTLQQPVSVTISTEPSPGITLLPLATLFSSSTPQTSALTQSTPGISPSSIPSDVSLTLTTDPTTSVSETTPSPSPTSAFLSSSNVSSTPLPQKPQKPSIYIKMLFSMPWGRFCYLTSLFKESLSRNLLEFDGVTWHYMPLERIRLYNAKEKCANKTLFYNKDTILELFIARMGEENDADKNKTIEGFKLLYGYWTNKRMILLDPVFEGKVTKVVLVGDDEDEYIPEYTEAQRIGIAIGVALAILIVVLIVIYFVKRYCMITHQARPKPADGKMVITNEHAFEETTASDLTNAASKPLETQEEMSEVPEQVVVHKQPSPTQTKKSQVDVKVEDKTPLLSMIKDYEDGKSGGETKSDQEASETEVALEPENVDGRPIKPPRSDSMIDAEIVLPESISQISKVLDTEGQVKNEEVGIEPVQTVEERTEPGKNEEEGTEPGKTEEEGKEERRPSFTSSVTVNIRPEAATISKELDYPAKEQPPDSQTDNNNQAPTGDDEISEDEKLKPDFGQSDSGDADPNEGAINLGFDDDEAQKEEKKKEEETKF